MLLAHKIRLDPNNVQQTYLARAAGVARFAYNWALAEWQSQYAAHKENPTKKRPNEAALRRQLNSIKHDEFPWMLKVTKCAPQTAIIQLGRAFENFFAGRARYPKFRRKGTADHFTISNDQFRVEGKRIRIPKLGWVRMREELRFKGHIVSASVSRTADHWYASITVDCQDFPLAYTKNQGVVGVDLGITTFATLSTGEKVDGPKALRRLLSSVKRLSRALSHKVRGSSNWTKARLRLAKLHEKIAHIRRDAIHQLTTSLTRRFRAIGIEDLNVSGMLKNHRLALAITDMGFFEFRRQLEYKALLRCGQVVIADRWYPSSKICSNCSYVVKVLDLANRNWTCPGCGTVHDRDINAASNLKQIAVSSTVLACGGEGSGMSRECMAQPAPSKQESNLKV